MDVPVKLTKYGNRKPPTKTNILEWLMASWEDLPSDIVQRSFRKAGISLAMDGLRSAYMQVRLEESAREKTAFTIPFGLFPSTFARLMENVLRGLQPHTCLTYLDDNIVHSDEDIANHLANLEAMFQRYQFETDKFKDDIVRRVAERHMSEEEEKKRTGGDVFNERMAKWIEKRFQSLNLMISADKTEILAYKFTKARLKPILLDPPIKIGKGVIRGGIPADSKPLIYLGTKINRPATYAQLRKTGWLSQKNADFRCDETRHRADPTRRKTRGTCVPTEARLY
ncbi:hypothetical protein Bbelb_284100 [Branchiostoma belcheri]|nr:hypothetical protein Bbelb_284100 [Branchiostoma belcheri]